jgi:hypoxanthine phosphoribosyltransferase
MKLLHCFIATLLDIEFSRNNDYTTVMSEGNGSRIIYTKEQIDQRVAELAKEIAADYRGEKVVMIGILKGAFIFFADLIRKLHKEGLRDVIVDFMTISAYGSGTTHSGQTHVLADITKDISGKHVIVVEDIVDTGHTLVFVREYLQAKKPASLKFAVFLDKIERREVEFTPDYLGFTLTGKPWIEGYGLDGGEYGRGRPDIAAKIPHQVYRRRLRLSLSQDY